MKTIASKMTLAIGSTLLALTSAFGVTTADSTWSTTYALEAKGQYVQAAKDMKALLNDRQGGEFAWLRYAWLTYMSRDYNNSVAAYRKAASLNPSSIEARLGLTLPLMAQEKWVETSSVLEQVLKTDPWNYTAHSRLIYIESLLEKWPVLEKHAADVSARFPSDVSTLLYLAYAKDRLNKVDESKAIYKKVLERYPGHQTAVAYLAKH